MAPIAAADLEEYYRAPFPDEVPTIQLAKLDIEQLIEGGKEAMQTLFRVCCNGGFFQLDLTAHEQGRQFLKESEELHQVAKDVFNDVSMEEKFAYQPGDALKEHSDFRNGPLRYPERFFNTRPEDHDYIEAWMVRRGLDPDFYSWFINWCIKITSQHQDLASDPNRPGAAFERQLINYLCGPLLDASRYCRFLAYFLNSATTGGRPVWTVIPRDADVAQKEEGQEILRRMLNQTGRTSQQGRRARRQRAARMQEQMEGLELGGASVDEGPLEAEEEMEVEEAEEGEAAGF
ncbi:MAG: hypothetical protein M1821_004941 [Bathelium mastoideum]|nr:MAG: hypothetical protein M1821_004941 [Bathelium mastoideum]